MRYIKSVVSVFIILILWSFISEYTNPLFLPKPGKVVDNFIELFNNGMLLKAIWYSFFRITLATAISTIIGVPMALLMCNYNVVDVLISPFTNKIRYVPVTIFYSLLIMWFGIGEVMKVAFLFVATFFFFLPSTILSIRDTNRDLIDTAYTMGMSNFQVMRRVLLPYSLPSICQNILMMYSVGWTYVIIAEIVNANAGLGHIINLGSARGRTDLVYMAIIVIVVLSWLFDTLGNKIIRAVFKWKFAREITGG